MFNPLARKISQLDPEPGAAPDLAGGLLEMSLPRGGGLYASVKVTTEQLATAMPGGSANPGGAAGGAPQWVKDTPYLEGALVFDKGLVYRASRDILNGTTPPAGELAWEADVWGTGSATSAGPYKVTYPVTVGQTSIGPAEIPELANATDIISIGNAASDGRRKSS